MKADELVVRYLFQYQGPIGEQLIPNLEMPLEMCFKVLMCICNKYQQLSSEGDAVSYRWILWLLTRDLIDSLKPQLIMCTFVL